jgi:hypothetical protein
MHAVQNHINNAALLIFVSFHANPVRGCDPEIHGTREEFVAPGFSEPVRAFPDVQPDMVLRAMIASK